MEENNDTKPGILSDDILKSLKGEIKIKFPHILTIYTDGKIEVFGITIRKGG